MSIRIEPSHCIGCGKCVNICPGTLLKIDDDKKARIAYPECCWGCACCLKECPTDAISFFLGADIGGQGSIMQIERKANITKWIITKSDKQKIILETDSTKANKY